MAQLAVIVMCRSERPPPDATCSPASSATKSSTTQKAAYVPGHISRQFIQTIRFVMLGSIVAYGYIVWWLPSVAIPNPLLFRVLTVVSVTLVVGIFVVRQLQVSPVESVLAVQPDDAKALGRWRQGYVVTYVLSEAIVLYGFVLHFLGFRATKAAPFFVAGFVLILFFRPMALPVRQPR